MTRNETALCGLKEAKGNKLYLLIAVFLISLLIAVGASALFTRRLEVVSDLFQMSPGLLSLLGALGANIPNYVASFAAAASGQVGVGMGIIVGSNISNIAVILAIAAFAAPARRGMTLSPQEARDARPVGGFAFSMMVTTAFAAGCFSWKIAPHTSHWAMPFASIALLALNLLTLGLFCGLSAHALRHKSGPHILAKRASRQGQRAGAECSSGGWGILRVLGEVILALAIALGGVIVMVQTGEAVASEIRLSQAILSLIVLAVATSLPNTIVAFTLARTGRASASVEEVFSSNGVNAALGIAAPLLFWSGMQSDRLLVVLDAPLMVALTLLAFLCVQTAGEPCRWGATRSGLRLLDCHPSSSVARTA